MTEHRFTAPSDLGVYVEIPGGSITVEATDQDGDEPTAYVGVEGPGADDVVVTLEGSELSVVAPRRSGFHLVPQGYRVVLRVPPGADLATRTGAADLVAAGALGAVSLRSGSGDVDLAEVRGPGRIEVGSGDVSLGHAHDELRVKSGSGRVELRRIAGETRVSTGSGDVVIGDCAATALVKTGSGDLHVHEATADLALSTGSGDLVVETMRRGRATVKGATGAVRLGVPAGVPVWTDVSTVTGRVSSTVRGTGAPAEGQDHVELHATTVSGDVVLLER